MLTFITYLSPAIWLTVVAIHIVSKRKEFDRMDVLLPSIAALIYATAEVVELFKGN